MLKARKKTFRAIEEEPNDYKGPMSVNLIPRIRRVLEEYVFTEDEAEDKRLLDLAKIVGLQKSSFMFEGGVASQYNDVYNWLIGIQAKWIEDVTQNLDVVVQLVNWINADEIVVQESGIPNSGYGLFATKKYKMSDGIVVYGGIHMSDNIYDYGGPEENGYTISVESDDYPEAKGLTVDGYRCFKLSEPGRWANSHQTAYLNNAQFELKYIEITYTKTRIDKGVKTVYKETTGHYEVWVVATKPIAKGQEVFVTYGSNYDWTFNYANARCGSCATPGAQFKCARCQEIRYCGDECQRNHWETHKLFCNDDGKP